MTVPSWWVCLHCEIGWCGDPCCPDCDRTVTTHTGLGALVTPARNTWTHEVHGTPQSRR